MPIPPKVHPKMTKSKPKHTNKINQNQNQNQDVIQKATSQMSSYTHYLVIVESPSKCKKIEDFLGKNYKCIATKGHLREIEGLKSIHTKGDYEIQFSNTGSKSRHIEEMRAIISEYHYTNIFLASDDDREGESIAWHVCQLFRLPIDLTPRIVFHEITADAVLHAIQHPRTVDMNIVKAQHARQILDMLIGFKISPYLWKYIYSSKSSSLSAGRCQTPALRLVYENEIEKSKQDIVKKYRTTAFFFSHLTPFVLKKELDQPETVEQFLELSKKFPYSLHVEEAKESIKQPPKPFNTSRLLQTASNLMHASPKETMQLLQTLYQDGYITYMRTESMQYSKEFITKATDYIEKEWNRSYLGKTDSICNQSANNPHEAIRVTKIEYKTIPTVKDNPRLSTLYKIIWKNTIQSLMSPAKYKCNTIEISAPMDHTYTNVVETPIFLGWQCIQDGNFQSTTDWQRQNESMLLFYRTIENTKQAFIADHIESTVIVHFHHSHYTESSLIHKLEELGIGRPSTFSLLVDTIQDRGYVKKTNVPGISVECVDYKMKKDKIEKQIHTKIFGAEKNKLVIQPIGILTIEFLLQYFQSIFTYEYSKNMEDELDKIANHETMNLETDKWYSICQHCHSEIKELSKQMNHLTKQTFTIDDKHSVVFQQYGPVIRKTKEDGTFEYKTIRKDITLDLQKLKDSVYTLVDLLEIQNDCLGTYQDIPVYLKSGQYGAYIDYNGTNHSIRTLQIPLNSIGMNDILHLLDPSYSSVNTIETNIEKEEKNNKEVKEDSTNKDSNIHLNHTHTHQEKEKTENGLRKPPLIIENKNIIRNIHPDLSIRKGKFGAYIYYKTNEMKNPEFFSLKKFKKGFNTCTKEELLQWICENYKLNITP